MDFMINLAIKCFWEMRPWSVLLVVCLVCVLPPSPSCQLLGLTFVNHVDFHAVCVLHSKFVMCSSCMQSVHKANLFTTEYISKFRKILLTNLLNLTNTNNIFHALDQSCRQWALAVSIRFVIIESAVADVKS